MTTKVAPANVPSFAGIVLLVLGVFNIIDGFMLLNRGKYLDEVFLASNADTWGWIMIGFAALQLIAGLALLNSGGARWLAITVASVSMMLWFAMLFATPFAALLGVGLNFAVIANVLSTEKA